MSFLGDEEEEEVADEEDLSSDEGKPRLLYVVNTHYNGLILELAKFFCPFGPSFRDCT